jgi:putative two-component system response regulator
MRNLVFTVRKEKILTAAAGESHQQHMPATILIADDHYSSRAGLEGLLSLEGYQVVTAGDGEMALIEFRRTKPDLLLLDINMPKMCGTDVCRRIKNDPETRLVPVVLVTALTATEDRIRGIDAGADDFVTKPVEREQLIARVRSLLRQKAFTDELERAESVLFALALSIEGKDSYTQGHCERLSEYSARLGEHLGLPVAEIKALRRAGIVHDIGKVAVPDSILLKPGRLTRSEQLIVQRHPVVGERICAPLKSFQLVLPIIRHHHEKMNGSGYPDGLKGDEIPMTARVLSIVDVYDAITTQRPYKVRMAIPDALAVMRKEVRKDWWDPSVFAAFEQLVQAEEKKPLAKAMAAAAE